MLRRNNRRRAAQGAGVDAAALAAPDAPVDATAIWASRASLKWYALRLVGGSGIGRPSMGTGWIAGGLSSSPCLRASA